MFDHPARGDAHALPNLRRAARRFSRRLVSTFCLGALCASVLIPTTGCFGRFPLTSDVYDINLTASGNEFYQSVVFWTLIIIPIYPGALIIDSLVLNPIEFWQTEPEYYSGIPGNPRNSFSSSGATAPLPPVKPTGARIKPGSRTAWFPSEIEEDLPGPPPERPHRPTIFNKP